MDAQFRRHAAVDLVEKGAELHCTVALAAGADQVPVLMSRAANRSVVP